MLVCARVLLLSLYQPILSVSSGDKAGGREVVQEESDPYADTVSARLAALQNCLGSGRPGELNSLRLSLDREAWTLSLHWW